MARCTLTVFLLFIGFTRGFALTIKTPVGDINGEMETVSVHGRQETVHTFLGIPYAEPPTGHRRLARPVPKARFTVPYDAVSHGPSCYAKVLDMFPGHNLTSEDCLVLNIFSPNRPTGSDTFPVMVWIHGGGFVLGSSTDFKGEYFSASGQVILVTINYRLAVLGFLSTMDDVIPGNYGLWDQHLAIKWVHDNIATFGGDPSRVTIFGESAGSASVVYQMLYPGNLGLFQRAIGESGSVTSPWARKNSTLATEDTDKFGEAVNCSKQTSAELLQCLRTKSAVEINATMNGGHGVPQEWTPVIDNDFLLDFPDRIMDGSSAASAAVYMFNSVDLIIGVNSLDGAASAGTWGSLLNKSDIANLKVTKAEFEEILIPYYLKEYYKTETPNVAKEVMRSAYTDWSDPFDDIKRLQKLSDLSTDVEFRVPSIDVADDHRRYSLKSTYTYEFAVPMYPFRYFPIPFGLDGPEASYHGDEIVYLFHFELPNLDVNQKAIFLRVSKAMITMWTNFAKTGNPNQPVDATSITNVIWPQYGAEENYLEITATMTSQSVRQRMGQKAVNLFKKLVPAVMKAAQCRPCQTNGHSGIIFG